MNFFKKLFCNKQSLGEALAKVKEKFDILEEVLPRIPGQRLYRTKDGNFVTIVSNTPTVNGIQIKQILKDANANISKLYKKFVGKPKMVHKQNYEVVNGSKTALKTQKYTETFASKNNEFLPRIISETNEITGETVKYYSYPRYDNNISINIKRIYPTKNKMGI